MPRKIKSQPAPPTRLLWVDSLRGIAIVLMVIFHFCYDLRYFGYVNWGVPNGDGWWQFRYLILSLFIFTVGISLWLAHGKQFKRRSFVKRLKQLILASIAITVMSLFMFPTAWIYFGILHFITAASLLGLPLIKRPRLALILGTFILVSYWLSWLKSSWPFEWFSFLLPQYTEDFVPLFPWLGVMYIGLGLAAAVPIRAFDIPHNTVTQPLIWMGKHGLVIYLIHQPILFSGFFVVKLLI